MAEPGEDHEAEYVDFYGNKHFFVTRQQLYDRVWAIPLSEAAEMYNISKAKLVLTCRDLRVPTPYSGYWQRRQHHKSSEKTDLPAPEDAARGFYYSTRPRWRPRQRKQGQHEAVAIEEENGDRIAVPEILEEFHPLIERTFSHLRRAKPNEKGLLRPTALTYPFVSVTEGMLDRAQRIMNTLFLAFAQRKYRIEVVDGKTHVTVLGEAISFRIDERLNRIAIPWTKEELRKQEADKKSIKWWTPPTHKYNHFPTGKLYISVYVGNSLRRTWQDGKKLPLEMQVNGFLAGLIRIADDLKVDEVAAEEARKRLATEAREREERERRYEIEMARQERMEMAANAWARSEDLRRFVEAVRAEAIRRGEVTDNSSGVGRWLAWAEKRILELNSLAEGRPLPEM